MSAKNLAGWIFSHYATSKEALTHLKLQKLSFYCYGALMAYGRENEVGVMPFEAWEHGPVSREIWNHFKHSGSSPLHSDLKAGTYSKFATDVLQATVDIYGAMDAWSLRQQSHMEMPWKEAFEKKVQEISPERMKSYFVNKFGSGQVEAPEYLFGLSSFTIDNIPIQKYDSIFTLADIVRRVTKKI